MSNKNRYIYIPEIPFEIFKKLNTSKDNILIELSALMTDEMLWLIASADYGYKKEECFNYLKDIISTKKTPSNVAFILGECLELAHYKEPQNREEHIIRAFCSTLLLILENTSDHQSMCDESVTLVALLDSVIALKIAHHSTQELIIWRILSDYNKEKELHLLDDKDKQSIEDIYVNDFFIYSLLILMVFNKEKQEHIESYLTDIEKKKGFRVRTHYFNECRSSNIWKNLSNEMIQWKTYITSEKTISKLDMIIDCIINNKPMIKNYN